VRAETVSELKRRTSNSIEQRQICNQRPETSAREEETEKQFSSRRKWAALRPRTVSGRRLSLAANCARGTTIARQQAAKQDS